MKTKFQRLSFPPFPFYWFPKLKFHSKNKNYWNNHNNNYNNNKNHKSKRNNKISTSWFPSNTTQTLKDIHDNYSDNSNPSSNQSFNDTSDSDDYPLNYKIDNDIDEFYYHHQEAEILYRIRQMNLPPKSPPSPSAAYSSSSSSRPGPGTAAAAAAGGGGTGTSTNMTSADKQMEERAKRAKELLSMRYKGLKTEQESKHHRKMQLEKQMLQLNLSEENKTLLRQHLETEEIQISKTQRKKVTCADFESLAIIGRGAFGEVRLVRNKTKHKTATTARTGLTSSSSSSISTPSSSSPIKMYALKSMKKEMMVMKNQVGHVKAERDALAEADDNNRWLTMLHYSFTDETHLYMVMEYMPGGDLMSLLIKEDTFSEEVTKFFMAEAAQAIASVHALGYIHRDIKPDNMLLDERGHLKLTDLGLCKKVGDVSPEDHPDVVLEFLKQEETVLGEMVLKEEDDKNLLCIDSMQNHPSSSSSSSSFQPKKPERWTNSKARREMAYSTVGTPDYIAPEVLAAQNGSSGYSYTCAVDWWSLGVIMYECLVGYTPFYAEDPVTTCRKILRWRQCLEIPADKKAQLSAECLDFMSCLLAGPESRIGSSIHGDEFKNGFVQVVQHPWFAGFDWEGLYDREGPLLPSGTHEFPWILEQLKNCPKTDPRFHDLVKKATQNFDTFEDFGSNLDTEDGRKRVERSNLDQFYDYHFRRVPKPNVLSTSKVDLP